MNIIWCTSFNGKLWKASGSRLLNSFLNFSPAGKLFCGTEDCKDILFPIKECLWFKNIADNKILKHFLSSNRDVIPKAFGGNAKPCKCVSDKKHKRACHYSWWNRNCSRWFRKFVTLNEAIKTWKKIDYLIWIDCDCYFRGKGLNESFIHEILFQYDEYDLFYLKGPDRPIAETGLVGYNLRTKGLDLFSTIMESYTSGNFRQFNRWDDSAITQKFASRPEYRINDIAGRKGAHSEVFTDSLIGQYIYHDKGLHGRVKGIFK